MDQRERGHGWRPLTKRLFWAKSSVKQGYELGGAYLQILHILLVWRVAPRVLTWGPEAPVVLGGRGGELWRWLEMGKGGSCPLTQCWNQRRRPEFNVGSLPSQAHWVTFCGWNTRFLCLRKSWRKALSKAQYTQKGICYLVCQLGCWKSKQGPNGGLPWWFRD